MSRTSRNEPAERRPDPATHVEEGLQGAERTVAIVDLFAGIGGFHYGIAAAARRRSMGVRPILVSEIEPTCQETYRRNHRCEVRGDVTDRSIERDHCGTADVLSAGFPCQPFSNSGRKLGLKDPRGRFYSRIVELIEHFEAKSFILENVPGLLTNGGTRRYPSILRPTGGIRVGSTMHTLERHLSELRNYAVTWLEIDSSTLGSPQVRKRVYVVGVRREFVRADLRLLPTRQDPRPFISVVDDENIPALRLSAKQEANVRSFMHRGKGPSYKDGMRRVGQAYLCKGGNVGQAYHAHGLTPALTKIWARFLPIYFPADGEGTPEVGRREFTPDHLYGKGELRRVSVGEAMLIQGFPPTFQPHERDSVAYEHAGNAVNALVVREIADQLLDLLA
jgi:DNA (cytosine-5)-methyltransferase 1